MLNATGMIGPFSLMMRELAFLQTPC